MRRSPGNSADLKDRSLREFGATVEPTAKDHSWGVAMDRSIVLVQGMESMLSELTELDLAALSAAQAGDQRDLCDASERLIALHARFAALYRRMLASPARPAAPRAGPGTRRCPT
jgi:hypothetical protein